MLIANARAPSHSIAVSQLAKICGYRSSNAAWLQYGRLGTFIGRALGQQRDIKTRILGKDDRRTPTGEVRWKLHPPVYEALKLKGWVQRAAVNSEGTLPTLKQVQADLEAEVAAAAQRSQAIRLKRLQRAPKLPTQINVVTTSFRRNPDVIIEVLIRANGHCEACGKPAPFRCASDGRPYLEVHHRKQLSLGGEDTVENAVAVCPNCHREAHFGTVQQMHGPYPRDPEHTSRRAPRNNMQPVRHDPQ